MIAVWIIKDLDGTTVASSTVRLVTPADGPSCYNQALRVANSIENGLLDFVGPEAVPLPLLRAAE